MVTTRWHGQLNRFRGRCGYRVVKLPKCNESCWSEWKSLSVCPRGRERERESCNMTEYNEKNPFSWEMLAYVTHIHYWVGELQHLLSFARHTRISYFYVLDAKKWAFSSTFFTNSPLCGERGQREKEWQVSLSDPFLRTGWSDLWSSNPFSLSPFQVESGADRQSPLLCGHSLSPSLLHPWTRAS